MKKLKWFMSVAVVLCAADTVTAEVEHHCPLFSLWEQEPGTCWFYCDGNQMNAMGTGCEFVEATINMFPETHSPVPYEICPDHCDPPAPEEPAGQDELTPEPAAATEAEREAAAPAAFSGYPGGAWKKDSPGVPELQERAKRVVTVSNPTDKTKFHTGGRQFLKATLKDGNTEVTKYFRIFEIQFIDGKPHGTRNKNYRLIALEMTGAAPGAAELYTATGVRKLQEKVWTSTFKLTSGDVEYVLLVQSK